MWIKNFHINLVNARKSGFLDNGAVTLCQTPSALRDIAQFQIAKFGVVRAHKCIFLPFLHIKIFINKNINTCIMRNQ